MIQRPKSEPRQQRDMKGEVNTFKFAGHAPSIEKRYWASLTHSVVIEDRNEVREFVHVFCWSKQNKKRRKRDDGSTEHFHFGGAFLDDQCELQLSGRVSSNSPSLTACEMHGSDACAYFDFTSQLCLLDRCIFWPMFTFSRTIMLGNGWAVVLNDSNTVIKQESVTF